MFSYRYIYFYSLQYEMMNWTVGQKAEEPELLFCSLLDHLDSPGRRLHSSSAVVRVNALLPW